MWSHSHTFHHDKLDSEVVIDRLLMNELTFFYQIPCICFSIDYDFAANVTVFAAKISRLIFNDFAANLLTNSRLFHVFSPILKM